eukprot:scaffold67192_cov32-Tisochrysis_lutea.AAC.7
MSFISIPFSSVNLLLQVGVNGGLAPPSLSRTPPGVGPYNQPQRGQWLSLSLHCPLSCLAGPLGAHSGPLTLAPAPAFWHRLGIQQSDPDTASGRGSRFALPPRPHWACPQANSPPPPLVAR